MNITSLQSSLSGAQLAIPPVAERPAPKQSNSLTEPSAKVSAPEALQQRPQAADQTQRQDLAEAVKNVNEFVLPINNQLRFSMDDESDKMVVKVIDQTTKEVIRQIPSEEMLAIAKALDTMKGLLIQQKA